MNNVSETESLDGKLATYPLGKSFAQRLYDTMDNIYATQEILDHKNVNTTQKYLDINYAKVRDAVESMVGMVESESDIMMNLSNFGMAWYQARDNPSRICESRFAGGSKGMSIGL